MAKKATLQDLMNELKAIKKLVLRDLQIDTEDIKFDKKRFNKKSIGKSKKIFDDPGEWKIHIWDECSHKKAIQRKREVDYNCKLLKGKCKFEHCPLNIKKG